MFNTPCWPFPCFSMFGMCSSTPCCRLQVASRRTWLLPSWYTDKSVWNVSSIPNYLSFKHIPHKPTKESGSSTITTRDCVPWYCSQIPQSIIEKLLVCYIPRLSFSYDHTTRKEEDTSFYFPSGEVVLSWFSPLFSFFSARNVKLVVRVASTFWDKSRSM